ncbi:ATP-dependent DNA helicase [Aquibacillus koreensis]|uniref:ATP-dependent DNA helicase n=1 Tax=Aquibacillus koreensis TaxID=279446 RepID=A0A9X4AJR0_9BACI|nr:ATP-dependent DNA helicase [Aquibacillus koreensis]MCT2535332.1 ATP-dependent DNA helicase [Aquibacillus koreensis]MDC3422497.1 ATP-dependent DNA helicase [Aquibacillus koreensis]
MAIIVKISVRNLVEYVYRSGSIESGFRTSRAMTEGTRIHQLIQKGYQEHDEKEVFVEADIPYQDFVVRVDGRCDGLLKGEESVTIDEIKSTVHALDDVQEDTYPVHWAQAIFYGYIYAGDHDLSEVTIQLTYVQVKTMEQKKFRRVMTYEEMKSFVYDVIEQYGPFLSVKLEHKEKRNKTSKTLQFPFESYREGQRKLAGAVYKTIDDKKTLFASASTGIGKTISTIFPAVKAIGEGKLEKLFYLTAKTITRTTAEEAFQQLIDHGLDIKVLTITAKDKICFQEETICTSKDCPFADGFYDRINGAVIDILEQEKMIDRTVIERYARKHRLCPFEYSIELAYAVDAVICDYNYIFDPRVSLKRLLEDQKKKTTILVDEAHNLVDRAREMYSAVIHKSNFLQLKREFNNSRLATQAKAINDYLLQVKKSEEYLRKDLDEDLVELLETFIIEAEGELVRTEHALLLDTYFAAQTFVKIAKLYNEQFITYVEVHKSEVMMKLFCLDPSEQILKMGKGFGARVFFSATLIPGDYYKDLLGGQSDDYVISIPSPFARENTEVMIQPLSTRYRDREKTIEPMVHFMKDVIDKKNGNFLIFFPSYQYMRTAYEQFTDYYPSVSTIMQDVGMTEAEREDFLAQFNSERAERLVGFAVLGGIFSEGVDLKGDRLQGVIVVGVGMPQIGFERDIIKDYFQSVGKNGFDYAYVYPGMNKVLQAGGRLIRSDSDTGVIALIDDRFLQKKYQALIPYEWQHYRVGGV